MLMKNSLLAPSSLNPWRQLQQLRPLRSKHASLVMYDFVNFWGQKGKLVLAVKLGEALTHVIVAFSVASFLNILC